MSVQHILKWLTAAKNIPPLRFSKKIQCQFLDGCPAGCKCRSTTSTCDLVLTLPVHLNKEDDMKEIMYSSPIDCLDLGLL